MQVSTPSERLQAMDDFRIVRFFQTWANDLCTAVTDPAAIIAGVPDEIRTTSEFAAISELSPEQAVTPIAATDAAPMVRAILAPLAESPQLHASLKDSLDAFNDDKLVVDVILALGLVASVLMIISSCEYDDGFKFNVDPEKMKVIMGSVFGRGALWRATGPSADASVHR